MTRIDIVSGPDRFEEAMAYVEKHQLYDHALSIWRDTDKYQVRYPGSSRLPLVLNAFQAVLNIYGDWLFERRDFRDAAFGERQRSKHSDWRLFAIQCSARRTGSRRP